MRVFYRLFVLFAVLFSACSSEPKTYSLKTTAVPQEAGSVSPDEGNFDAYDELEIAAYPNEHWVFERWEGDYDGTENPAIITLDSDKDIAAIFAKRDYPLTVETVGEGTVTEQIVQQKSTEYPHGTVVELTAEPAVGWEFTEWQGDLEGSENPATITIDGASEVTAVFEKINYPLTVNIVGEGEVTEEVIQAKTTDYPYGTSVKLTAIPDSNWTFTEWEGDIESTENPVEITIDEAKTVTATFERTFILTTIAVPDEGGAIEPSGGEFVRDTSFDVEAIPAEGWTFVEWRGDFTRTTNPFNLTMNGNKTLEAHFEQLSYTLQTNTVGNGEVLTNVLSGSETEGGYTLNSEVELTALPAEDWHFVRWEGDITGTANPATITIDGSKSVTAVFEFFDGGSGTAEDPYQISDICQVQAMEDYLDSHFVLIQDVDASDLTGCDDESDGFNPVGDAVNSFTGSFDGGGFEITNLTIDQSMMDNVGLFGVAAEGSVIQNVILSNATINGNNQVGALVGQNHGSILVSASTGAVTGTNSNTGGLVGQNMGSIQQSFSSATINGSMVVGGLVGENSSTVEKSYALGDASGTDNVGGLAGINAAGGSITETFAAGNVTGTFTTGGLTGTNNATVSSSYWDTNSTGQLTGTGSGATTGMTGLTTAQMTGPDAETYMADFDFISTWSTTPADYPVLFWQEE